MNKIEILEGKKSIALFMDFEVSGEMICSPEHEQHISRCHYDKHWDWLMPVVEKIEALGYTTHTSVLSNHLGIGKHMYVFKIQFSDKFGVDYHESFSFTNKIEAVFKSVVEFIKWYNDKK